MKKLTLHIGNPKTGTSYLHRFFRLNTAKLSSLGVNYCTFFEGNQGEIALPFTSEISRRHLGSKIHDEAGQNAYKDQLDQVFRDNITDGHWLLSTELIAGRVDTREGIGSMREFLARHFEQVTILLYVRRQDFMWPSAYSTSVRGGDPRPPWDEALWFAPAPQSPQRLQYSRLYYDELVARWRDEFGDKNVIVRPFLERWKSSETAIRDDFLGALGIAGKHDWQMPPKSVNASASAEALAILRLTTSLVPASREGKSTIGRRRALDQAVRDLCPGQTIRMPEDAARRLLEYLRPGNEQFVDSERSAEWTRWLEQPLATEGPSALPDLTAERAAEVICRAAENSGSKIWHWNKANH